MTRSPRKQLVSALTACAGALAYTVSKVDLARDGELGMPGFPAPPEAYAQVADVTAAQLGNAGLGLLMAVVSLVLVRPPAAHWLRRSAVGVSWLGVAMVGAGVIGFGARAAGLAPGLGDTPPRMATAVAALAVGALWVAGWSVAAAGATRGRRAARAAGER
ncbi:hypothetical protein ACFY04_20045 [Streptomyces sp. NPDC001549]|uniref:hypothetical protein n=1 Tax=Streptomyces sp. NPDC001549 TaxID=3364586 RepID=UPI003697D9FD